MHVVLLGDSIFDNARYVGGGTDVVDHLRAALGPEHKATLLAVDGSRIEEVPRQLRALPRDSTHLVVSAGGNNALVWTDILERRHVTLGAALTSLGEAANAFGAAYRRMLGAVSATERPFTVCTIYYPSFPDPKLQRIATAALAHFNDVLLYEAIACRVPVIDLRHVCSHPGDYANPIEPSDAGGSRIARAIVRVLREHRFETNSTTVYV